MANKNEKTTPTDEIVQQKFRENYLKKSNHGKFEEFKKTMSDKTQKFIPTGLPPLDEALKGGIRKGLTIIGGMPSSGKSALLGYISDNFAQSGNDVLIYALEMERNELISRSISRLTFELNSKQAKTSVEILENGVLSENYSSEEIDTINQAIEKYETYDEHLFVKDTSIRPLNLKDLANDIDDHVKATGKSPIVIVDYIQLLYPDSNEGDFSDKGAVDKIVSALKRYSTAFNTPIVAASSLSRKGYNSEIKFENFKESGLIEYSANVLISLRNVDVDKSGFFEKRKIELSILKNRGYKKDVKIQLEYIPDFNVFADCCYGTSTSSTRRKRSSK